MPSPRHSSASKCATPARAAPIMLATPCFMGPGAPRRQQGGLSSAGVTFSTGRAPPPPLPPAVKARRREVAFLVFMIFLFFCFSCRGCCLKSHRWRWALGSLPLLCSTGRPWVLSSPAAGPTEPKPGSPTRPALLWGAPWPRLHLPIALGSPRTKPNHSGKPT